MTAAPGRPDADLPAALTPARLALLAQLQREPIDVSCAQERFWFLEQLDPGNAAHHVAGRLHLRGLLDRLALARATTALALRHETLRTVFVPASPRPRQQLREGPLHELPDVDLRAVPAVARAERRAELARELLHTPFDLVHGPIARHQLVRLADATHDYLFCVHHVAVDGLSMQVLARELAALYAHFAKGTPLQLSVPPSYRLFALQQRRWLGSTAEQQLLADWQRHLAGLRPLELPADAEPAPPTPSAASCTAVLSDGAALLAAVAGNGLTPFQWLAAGLGVVLHRLCGADDVALGFPVLGRDAGHADAVGFFVNSCVLRLECAGAPTFAAFAAHVRARATWAFERRALPFERLVERLAPERHPTRHPLFTVLLHWIDFDVPATAFGDLELDYEPLTAGTLLDVGLFVRRRSSALHFELQFDARRFRAATMQRWLAALLEVLRAGLAAPTQTIAALPLLPLPARTELLVRARGPHLPRSTEAWFDRVLAAAQSTPGKAAVVGGDEVLDYADLRRRVHAAAAVLHQSGVRPGQRVAVLLPRTAELVVALLAIARVGACFVPIDLDQPERRQRTLLALARPDHAIVDAAVAAWPPVDVPRIASTRLQQANAAAAATAAALAPEAPAYVLFTSGSTGAPKGVLVPHRALGAFLQAAAIALEVGPSDWLLAITTVGFDIALLELLLPLWVGGTVQLAPTAAAGDPALLTRLLDDDRITVLQATPTTWRLLWRHGFAGRPTLRALVGGEALPGDLAAFLRTRCRAPVNLYGPTETTIWSLWWPIDAGPIAIGRPLPGTFVRVLDGHGGCLPLECTGELAIGGRGVALGYLDDPARTHERFLEDPLGEGVLYRTGDRVRQRTDGALVWLGRLDDQLKVHGVRIEPTEIEAALRQCEDVLDAAVAVRSQGGQPQLVAWIVPRPVADAALASTWLERWRAIWESTHTAPDEAAAPFAGWRDSTDGTPLPRVHMQALYAATASALRARRPRRVLEIGCGSGDLLWPLASELECWVGIDVAAPAVAQLRRTALARGLRHCTAHVAGTDALDAVVPPTPAFDLVVMHSVVQYLPDLASLVRLLDELAQRLLPGGAIFLGDVRLLGLLPALHASIALARAAATASGDDVRVAMHELAARDQELAVAPELFAALAAVHPRLRHAQLLLHTATHDDELTRFRAHVWLSADGGEEPAAPAVGATTLAAVAAAIAGGGAVQIEGLADPRSLPWVRAASALSAGATLAATQQAVAAARAEAAASCSLADLEALAVAHGLCLTLGPGAMAGTRTAGFRPPPGSRPTAASTRPAFSSAAFAAAHRELATDPLRTARTLAQEERVRRQLQTVLPPAVVPSVYAFVAALPRSPNGKLLRRALELPGAKIARPRVPPAEGWEQRIATIFARALGHEHVSADDDFFALGGHSLLATQVVAMLAHEHGVDVPLRALFAAPTVRALAAVAATAGALADLAVSPLPADAERPLLLAQERLWFLHRLAPADCADHLAGRLTIHPPLAAAVVVTAIAMVAARHELLSSRIDERDGRRRLVPAEPVLAIDQGSAAEFEAGCARRVQAAFDLGQQAPLRAHVHTGACTQVLFVLHHAAGDGVSLAVLARDLTAALTAVQTGARPQWAPLPFTPAAFAASERRRLLAAAPLHDAWRRMLDGAPHVLALPTDRPRPCELDRRGARCERVLEAGCWQRLRAHAAATGSTPFQVFSAVASLWLCRLTGSDDLLVGTISAGRAHPGLRDQVGCFVNLLPVRVRLPAAASFATFARAHQQALLSAIEHQGLPFAELVRLLDVARDLSRPPLVQVTIESFVPAGPPTLPGHTVTLDELPALGAKFELSWRLCTPAAGPARVVAEYATALFDPATVAGWLDSLLALLDAALGAPDALARELPMLTAAASNELLQLGAGPSLAASAVTLPDLVQQQADTVPAARAVTWVEPGSFRRAHCTYAELAAASERVAAALRAGGVGSGDVVAITLPRGGALLPALLGVMATGAAWLPLDADDPPARRVALARAAGARRQLGADKALVDAGIATLPLPAGPPAAVAPLRSAARAADVAYVLFTSGSAGPPKGVVVEHRALLHYLRVAAAHYFDGRGGGALVATALTFDLTITCLFAPLLRGEPVHLADPAPGLGAFVALHELPELSLLKLTPLHLRALRAAGRALPSARTVVLGGDVLRGEDLAALRAAGARIVNEYGPTETTVGCTAHEVIATAVGDVPIGRPLPGTTVAVVDAALQPLPRGAVGELCIAGPQLARGYLGDEDATARQFTAVPWASGGRLYRTGDRARWRSDGVLEFHGRADAQQKILGVRVEPGEVAAALRRVEGVTDALVLPIAAPTGGVHLGAWVTGEKAPLPDSLLRALAAALPASHLPRFVERMLQLPTNRHGKVDTAALPRPHTTPPAPAGNPPAADARALAVAALYQELLRSPVGPDDDFFAFGGDSILALQAASRARALGFDVAVRDVFVHRTPRALAAAARALPAPAPVAATPEFAPLLPMQHTWLAQHPTLPGHDVQAVVCRLVGDHAVADVQRALAATAAVHPLLRAGLDAGEQRLQVRTALPDCVHEQTLAAADPAELAALFAVANASHAPAAGRLLRATLVTLPTGRLLHLSIHHLVVDAVSWRALLADLDAALQGQTLAPTTPFATFAERLRARQLAGEFDAQRAFWARLLPPDLLLWPPAAPDAAPIAVERSCPWDANARTALALRHATAFECVVAAVGCALAARSGARHPFVVERHGRQDATLDLARTVGWFTAVHPLRVDAPVHGTPAGWLAAGKRALRAVPDAGIGHGALTCLGDVVWPDTRALLGVNFLGDLDLPVGTCLQVTDLDPGPLRAAGLAPPQRLQLDLWCRGGKLHARAHTAGGVAATAVVDLVDAVLQTATACLEAPVPATLVASDFPCARLQDDELAAAGLDSAVEDLFPLTPTQQGMWVHALQAPVSLAYTEQLVHEFEGDLDVEALAGSLRALQQRHTLLRARIVQRGLPEPHWLVERTPPLPWQTRKVPGDDAAATAWLLRFVQADRRLGFDFAVVSPWRCTHLLLSGQRHALVFTYHHSLLDGWSMPLLLAELVAGYAALRAGSEFRLPPALPYRDYVAFLQRQDLDGARAFWREQLAGFREPTSLGFDRGSHRGGSRPHHERERQLPAALTQQLRALQTRCALTSGVLAQAATALWLARAGGSDDVLFGLTVSGRPAELPAAETRIGLFINTVPVRVRLPAAEPVPDWLQRLQREHAAMLPWQWTPLPLSQAQSECAPGRSAFDLLLVFENYPLQQALQTSPPDLRPLATTTNERTSYPVTLVVIPGERWLVRVLYDPDRLADDDAPRFLAQWERALHALVQQEDRALATIDWLGDADRQLACLPGPPRVQPTARLATLADAQARWRLCVGGTHFTAAELLPNIAAVAHRLQERSVGPGDVVALHAGRCMQQIAALLGIWQAGAAVAPVDPAWPIERARKAAHSAACVLAIVADPAADLGVPLLSLAAAVAPAARPLPVAVATDALAAVLHTSGSTGAPKAVELGAAALLGYATAVRERFGLAPNDCVLQFAPLAFDTAFEELLPALLAGATVALRDDDLDPAAVLRQCARDRVSVLDLPTAYFHALVAAMTARGLALPECVRVCIVGGEALRAAPARAFLQRQPHVELWNTYGPTEATIVATWTRITTADAEAGEPLPIGVPVPGTTASVRDRQGRFVPAGAIGELWLSGPQLARRYRSSDGATTPSFATAPDAPGERCYRTGDRVRRRTDGRLEFHGRVDRLAKVRGHRVDPEAIEAHLAALPGIAAARVVPVTAHEAMQLVAFVVASGRPPTAMALRAALRRQLPPASVPARILVLPELPRTLHGKVDEHALAQLAAAREQPAEAAAATGPLAALQRAFASVLHLEVGPDDDFFALGGDSLAAIRLVDVVRKDAQLDASLTQVFAHPSPRLLAAVLAPDAPRTPPTPRADVTTQADLPPDWHVAAGDSRPVRRVLLTGASGFLGRHVLQALLARTTADVVVLQRRPSPLPESARVRALPGDLARAGFGVAPEQLRELADGIDAAYHVAANTGVFLPYSALHSDNVLGTRHVLDFCAKNGAALHHVSSVGVFAADELAFDTPVDETFDLTALRTFTSGYARSKWAAELLVQQARRRGLRATIYRPGRLAAGRDGVLPARDLGLGIFALCVELGRVPDADFAVDLTPVDWAAHALVALSLQPAAAGKVWHLMQRVPERTADLRARLANLGVPLRPVSMAEFQRLLAAFLQQRPDDALAPLAAMAAAAGGLEPGPRIASEATHAALATLGALAMPSAAVGDDTMLTALRHQETR